MSIWKSILALKNQKKKVSNLVYKKGLGLVLSLVAVCHVAGEF
jgi:hypothetical protein